MGFPGYVAIRAQPCAVNVAATRRLAILTALQWYMGTELEQGYLRHCKWVFTLGYEQSKTRFPISPQISHSLETAGHAHLQIHGCFTTTKPSHLYTLPHLPTTLSLSPISINLFFFLFLFSIIIIIIIIIVFFVFIIIIIIIISRKSGVNSHEDELQWLQSAAQRVQ